MNDKSKNNEKIPPLDKKNMDLAVKPGEDFYQYANGNWLKNNPIPDEFTSYGSFDLLIEENYKQLKDILETAANTPNAEKGSPEQLIGDFYKSGMDTNLIENLGIKPLQEDIQLIENAKNIKDIQAIIYKFHTIGVNALFEISAYQDEKNSQMVIAYLSQDGIGLPDRDYYVNDDEHTKQIRNEYIKYVNRTFELLNLSDSRYKKASEIIMKLETRLAKASMTMLERRDPYNTYNKMSVAEIIKNYPNFDWNSYFSYLGIPEIKEAILMQPKFFKEISDMQKDVSIEEWKVYLMWHLANSNMAYLSSPFVKAHFDFYGTTLSGSLKMRDRWKRVSSAADRSIGEAVGKLYVQKYFPPEAKEKMLDLVKNLKLALQSRIEQLDWMTNETKQKALEKLAAMNVKIGYPDKWLDYSSLQIDKTTYLQNIRAAYKFNFNENMSRIGKPVDRTKWEMYPQTVNAYYSPTMNEIVFPAAILQPPMFYLYADDAVNYGGIGTVIGHEMTHGFDDQGRLYDKNGNLQDWWTKQDAENFKKKTQILVDQYNKIVAIDTIKLNGSLTLGENIADLGGITVALEALKLSQKNKTIEKIDGFTPTQRFFLSYAQVWKENIRDKELRRRIQEDVHSPAKFRINGIVYNVPEFYEAFDVSEKDASYKPEKDRAKIW